jgi:hypothetical protein
MIASRCFPRRTEQTEVGEDQSGSDPQEALCDDKDEIN